MCPHLVEGEGSKPATLWALSYSLITVSIGEDTKKKTRSFYAAGLLFMSVR